MRIQSFQLKNYFMASSLVVMGLVVAPVFAKKKESKAAAAPAAGLKVDTAGVVTWKGTKVTGAHNGKIKIKEGTLQYADGQLKGGTVTIDMTSITCDDLTDAGYNKKLVDHLSNDDFFSVAKFPTATLNIKAAKALTGDAAGNTHEISGDLTIKGVTKPISFPAVVKSEAGVLTAKANIKVDRTAYGIKYGSGKFFQNLGDKAIAEEFEIGVDISAK